MGLKDPSLIIPSLNVSTTKLYDLPSLWFTIGKNWVLSIQVIRDQNVTPAQPTASSQISINTSALLQERVINLKIGSTLVFDLFFGIICPSKIKIKCVIPPEKNLLRELSDSLSLEEFHATSLLCLLLRLSWPTRFSGGSTINPKLSLSVYFLNWPKLKWDISYCQMVVVQNVRGILMPSKRSSCSEAVRI